MYLQDFELNKKIKLSPVKLAEEEIKAFALSFDPQQLHFEADKSPYGKIVASGYHTMCAVWRKFIETNPYGDEIIGGLGIENLRWLCPVAAGDTLYPTAEIADVRLSSKAGRGIVKVKICAYNQNDVLVIEFISAAMVKARQ